MAKINIACPKCKAVFKVDEIHIGKKGRCEKCGERFIISVPEESKKTTSSDVQAKVKVTQPAQPKTAQPVEATVRQDTSPGYAETIPTPKAKKAGDDISATIAAPTQKDTAEIQREEQDVPAEWEEGQTILDLYEVKKVHTGGGMGLVYRVHHKNWNMDLAVKSPRADYFKTEEQKQNFIKECETWINLGLHPNIVSCHYVRTLGGIPRVFAEYVEGGSLKDWIENKKLYEGGKEETFKRIIDIAIQFVWGLHYAHEQGLIHQDVKPANLMMTKEVEAKVTDFGLAKARSVAGEVMVVGSQQSILVSSGGMTPAYCSPEQANKQSLSRKTDIWSWGLSVLEMFAGEVFWRAGQAAPEALESFIEMGTEDKSIPKMPDGLIELLKQCFQYNPDDRPNDMAEVALRLKEVYKEKVEQEYLRPEPKPAELLADGLNNKAVSMLDLGKKEEAEKLYNEALEKDPHHPSAIYNRGLLLWRSGRMADVELVRQLEDVHRTGEENWFDKYLLGLVHLERGDCDSAIEILKGLEVADETQQDVATAFLVAQKLLSKSRKSIATMRGHTNLITSVCMTFDGQFMVSGSYDSTIKIWRISDGECIRTVNVGGQIDCMSLSPNGEYALVALSTGLLEYWDLNKEQRKMVYGQAVSPARLGDLPRILSISADFNSLIAISGSAYIYDRTARIWDLRSGKCLQTFAGMPQEVSAVWISPDGRNCLIGSGRTIILLDTKSGKLLQKFDGHEGRVDWLCVTQDQRYILSACADRTLKLWELSTGLCLRTLKGHTNFVSCAAIAPDGRCAVSSDYEGKMKLWEMTTGRCLRTFEAAVIDTDRERWWRVITLCIHNNSYAVSTSPDFTLKVWNLNWNFTAPSVLCRVSSTKETSVIEQKYQKALSQAKSAINNGDVVACADFVRQARALPGCLRTPEVMNEWANLYLYLPRKRLTGAWQVKLLKGHNRAITSICTGNDSRWCFSGSEDGEIKQWDIVNGCCLKTLLGHKDRVSSLCLSKDYRLLLSGSADWTIKLWDVHTGKCLNSFRQHNGAVTAARLLNDSSYIISGSADTLGVVKLYKVSNGQCLRTFGTASGMGYVGAIDISIDESRFICGWTDGHIDFYDITSGGCIKSIRDEYPITIESVQLSPDERHILSAGYGKAFDLYDISTNGCQRTLQGHSDNVRAACFSPDGKCIFSISDDHTIKVWDIHTEQYLHTLLSHDAAVTSIAISPNNRYLLSGGADNALKVWELDWDLECVQPSDWDRDAKCYLDAFLKLHCPYDSEGFNGVGKPVWDDEDFKKLVTELQYRGYGWLRPEGVRKKLEEMTANW